LSFNEKKSAGPRKVPLNRRSLGFALLDFLLRFVALIYFMRLSLRKGAHAALSTATWLESRVGMTKGVSLLLWRAVARIPGLKSETWGTLQLVAEQMRVINDLARKY
jgi:hypothetical protein